MTPISVADLRYASDDEPGLRRRRTGRGFTYLGLDGTTIKHQPTRERIPALA